MSLTSYLVIKNQLPVLYGHYTDIQSSVSEFEDTRRQELIRRIIHNNPDLTHSPRANVITYQTNPIDLHRAPFRCA
jgi:predicted regulator of amino acid metabolism with ACT domain